MESIWYEIKLLVETTIINSISPILDFLNSNMFQSSLDAVLAN